MRRYFCIVLCVFFLVSCGLQQVKNKREARLMPELIARQVLTLHFGPSWVSNPIGLDLATNSVANLLRSCEKYTSLPLKEITVVQVASLGQQKSLSVYKKLVPSLIMECRINVVHTIRRETPYTQDEIDDIVDALVSLGAKVTEVSR